MGDKELIMMLTECQITLSNQVAEMAQQIALLVKSNDRLTKALIDSYNETDGEEVPRTYMDGSEVK